MLFSLFHLAAHQKLTSFFEEFVGNSLIFASFDSHERRLGASSTVAEISSVDVTKMAVTDNLLQVDQVPRQLVIRHFEKSK